MNTTIRTKLYTALSCVMGTAALCTALSSSVEAQDAPSKTVRFSDLDITKSDGAKVLYSRIRAAARNVCELHTGTDAIQRLAIKACIDKAVDKAVKDVNAPMLTYLRFGSADLRLASK
ncbi:MAG: UrcA family protein [Pseudomonadota bacterium]|nr:UrcA family protein [Pseudomonadota bacterium]